MTNEQYGKLYKEFKDAFDAGYGIKVEDLLGGGICEDCDNNELDNYAPFGERVARSYSDTDIAVYEVTDEPLGYWCVGNVNGPWAIRISIIN